MKPSPDELPATWRQRANDLRRWAAAEGAAIALESAANELQEVLTRQDDDLLSLAEAAKVSGYSVDHLGRLLRQGKIPNRGRRHSPKIQRRDLPIRATAVARTRRGGYDPIADARNLLSRQGES